MPTPKVLWSDLSITYLSNVCSPTPGNCQTDKRSVERIICKAGSFHPLFTVIIQIGYSLLDNLISNSIVKISWETQLVYRLQSTGVYGRRLCRLVFYLELKRKKERRDPESEFLKRSSQPLLVGSMWACYNGHKHFVAIDWHDWITHHYKWHTLITLTSEI